MYGDKPISFYKGKIYDHLDANSAKKMIWKQLIADTAVNSIDQDYKAGIISFRLFFRKVD